METRGYDTLVCFQYSERCVTNTFEQAIGLGTLNGSAGVKGGRVIHAAAD